MPSSSTRKTKAEEQLLFLYQLIFMRFWFCGFKNEAYAITAYFEGLLDWPEDNGWKIVHTVSEDEQWLSQWEKFIKSTKDSANMSAVVEYFCDCSNVLRGKGRVKEADEFLRWVEEAQELEKKEVEYEESGSANTEPFPYGG